jgi:site-specific recombinase XerD
LLRNGREAPAVALRVLLRYLSFLGVIQDGLQGAIPQRPRWTHVGLPRHLPAADVERVVAGALDGSGRKGLRNYAILLLLARTGLRAHEVAQLSLDDINWTEGTICIRSKKTHTERRLPLAHDVGEALSDYLKHGRPACSFRSIFLRIIPPFDPFTGSAAVCRIARRALTHVGILGTPAAAHLFRHSAATGMLRGGATLKEIADVLGHASITTTAIREAGYCGSFASRDAMAGERAMSMRELRDQLEQYLAARSALGLKDRGRKSLLQDFLRYLVEVQCDGSIPCRVAVDWTTTTPIARATGLAGPARRLSAVRGFLSHLRASNPHVEVPPTRLLAAAKGRRPYLYSSQQIADLLRAALTIRPRGSLRPHTYATLLGLMASTGIRVGEAIRLKTYDVELDANVPLLQIRESKFG